MIILPEQVTKAIDVLEKSGYDAYIVGECVRERSSAATPPGLRYSHQRGDKRYPFRVQGLPYF